MPHLPLTDTQLMLLSAASRRDDHLITLPDTLRGGAAKAVVTKLLAHSFVEEVPVSRGKPAWSHGPDGQALGLMLTDAGLQAIGLEPDGVRADEPRPIHAARGNDPARRAVGGPARSRSKRALLIDLLSRQEGAGLEELMEVTGWLPHSTRAALTGLRQRGHAVSRSKNETGNSVYRITASPADVGLASDAEGV
jgi:hypothetical protein